MSTELRLYAATPLGARVGEVADRFQSELGSNPRWQLWSRSDRRDLPWEEALESATASRSDRLELTGATFKLALAWLYGPRALAFSQSLTISCDSALAPGLVPKILEICQRFGVFFGYCDLEHIVQRDVELSSRAGDPTRALVSPYWLMCFGREYDGVFPRRELAAAGVQVIQREGVNAMQLASRPEDVEERDRERVAKVWPAFLRYDQDAGLPAPVAIDLSAIHRMGAAMTRQESVAQTIGPPELFLASVNARRDRALAWAASLKAELKRPRDALRVARQQSAILNDDHEKLLDLVAAYGELVRTECGGHWAVGRLAHRGEPVVRCGFLSVRAVAREVMEAL